MSETVATLGSIERIYARALEPFDQRFIADALVEEAERATGLADWGGRSYAPERFRQRLVQLCSSLESETKLTPIGRTRAHARLHIVLCSRLRVIAYRASRPPSTPIVAPLIGTGFPRAGTSFLHELLSQDPDNLAATSAQAMIPVPPPGDPLIDAERSRFVDRTMRMLGLYEPQVDAVHPSGPDQPDECTLIQEGALGTVFNSMFGVPGYAAFAANQAQDLFDWEVALLQVLQVNRPRARWVLKTPEHMSNWQVMLGTFPDARIFLNHRDPAKVIPSICSLLATFSGLSTETRISPERIGARLCQGLAATMASVTAWRDAHPEAIVVDVHYRNLVADPIAEAERVYTAFGMTLSGAAREKMSGFLQRNRHGHGVQKHSYALADFGLTEQMIEDVFGDYIDRFGIEREARN